MSCLALLRSLPPMSCLALVLYPLTYELPGPPAVPLILGQYKAGAKAATVADADEPAAANTYIEESNPPALSFGNCSF